MRNRNLCSPNSTHPHRGVISSNWLIAILIIASVLGCGKTQPDEESRYLVDRGLSTGVSNQLTDDPNLDDTATIFAEDDIDLLIARAGVLLIRARRVSFAQRMDDLKTIVAISNRILQLHDRINDNQRLFAIQSKIRSLLQLHATGDRKYREELLEVINNYLEDQNGNVRRVSLTALAAARMSDFLRTSNGNFGKLKEVVTQIVTEFPENEIAAGELQDITLQLMLRKKQEQAVEIMQIMGDAYAKSPNQEFNQLAKILKDRAGLAQLQLDVVTKKFRKGDPGSRETLLDVVRKLSNMNDVGPDTYRELITAIRWLEEIDLYDEAKRALADISRNAPGYSNPMLVQQAAIDVQKGTARLNLLNQKLFISGQDAAGSRVTTDEFDNQILVLFFWSAEYLESVSRLENLMVVKERFGQGVQFVGVCVDKEATQATSVFRGRKPEWKNIYRTKNEDDEASIKSTRVQFVPYVMLLDSQHRVRDIHVRAKDLIDDIEKLLREKPRQDESSSSQPKMHHTS